MGSINKKDVCIYISGKYTGKDLREVEKNIRVAEEAAIKIAEKGIKYFCPHTHSNHMDFYAPKVTHEYWMDLDLYFIRKTATCMLMLPGWRASKGAVIEENLANELDLPIFESLSNLLYWYSKLDDS